MGCSRHKAKTTPMRSSVHQALLPLLVVVGTGAAAVGVAFISSSSSGLWGKTIAFLKHHCQQNGLPKVAFGDAREDRISQLPDDLLSYIVSQLDLTEAIRTRILARSWRNICRVRSTLVLDCRSMCGECGDLHNGGRLYHKRRFLKAVDQALQLYSGQKIVDLHLICCLGKKELSFNLIRLMSSKMPVFKNLKTLSLLMLHESAVDSQLFARVVNSCPRLELFRLQESNPDVDENQADEPGEGTTENLVIADGNRYRGIDVFGVVIPAALDVLGIFGPALAAAAIMFGVVRLTRKAEDSLDKLQLALVKFNKNIDKCNKNMDNLKQSLDKFNKVLRELRNC